MVLLLLDNLSSIYHRTYLPSYYLFFSQLLSFPVIIPVIIFFQLLSSPIVIIYQLLSFPSYYLSQLISVIIYLIPVIIFSQPARGQYITQPLFPINKFRHTVTLVFSSTHNIFLITLSSHRQGLIPQPDIIQILFFDPITFCLTMSLLALLNIVSNLSLHLRQQSLY